MDTKVLKIKLALCWMGPYKILAVGPCASSDTPDGFPLEDKLLHLDLTIDMPDSDAYAHVSVERCKPCTNPHSRSDMLKYLPNGLTQYVLNNFTKQSPPYQVTQDDVSAPLQRLEAERITSMAINRSVVGVGSSR